MLDYYEIEGTRTRRGGWWTLRLARPARFERDGAGGDGRRAADARRRHARAPLSAAAAGAHLRIAVEGS